MFRPWLFLPADSPLIWTETEGTRWTEEDTRRFVAERLLKSYRVRPVWTPQDTAALVHELEAEAEGGEI